MSWEVRQGDCLRLLQAMPSESVHCVVTSPPYWGLRDYKVEGQIGLESSVEEYVQKLVEVFREVRRVLHPSGTLWLNLGDTYWGGKGQSAHGGSEKQRVRFERNQSLNQEYQELGQFGVTLPKDGKHPYLKPKDLVGIPWRVAFALQSDGWYLRSDIIWAKPNPMPESVTDRPTKAHEYLFLMSKSERYYYDAEAIKEPAIYFDDDRKGRASTNHKSMPTAEHNGIRPVYKDARSYDGKHTDKQRGHGRRHAGFNERWDAMSKEEQCSAMRNKRSVWTIATQPFPDAHFATFPEKLVEPCIRAGTSEKGCCATCGAPWERNDEIDYDGRPTYGEWLKTKPRVLEGTKYDKGHKPQDSRGMGAGPPAYYHDVWNDQTPPRKPGWTLDCSHQTVPEACLVLDPFCGSGTTGIVALKLGHSFIGIELNLDYVKMAERRIGSVMPLFEARPHTGTDGCDTTLGGGDDG